MDRTEKNKQKILNLINLIETGDQTNINLALELDYSMNLGIREFYQHLKEITSVHTNNITYDIGEDEFHLTDMQINENTINPLLKYVNLYKLSFMDCNIKKFPSFIFEMNQLKEVSLHGCKLNEIPTDFEKLQSLETIYLGDNSLKEFPKPLLGIKPLRCVMLFRNNIEYISEEIKSLESLSILSLEGNPLVEPEKQIEQIKAWLPDCKVIF